MARRGKNVSNADKATKPVPEKSRRRAEAAGSNGLPTGYWKACELARPGRQTYFQVNSARADLHRQSR